MCSKTIFICVRCRRRSSRITQTNNCGKNCPNPIMKTDLLGPCDRCLREERDRMRNAEIQNKKLNWEYKRSN